MVEVTRLDRDTAEAWRRDYGRKASYQDLLQAFARHRIAAENAALERAAKVADELGGVRPKTADQEPFRAQHTRANTIATAIRALKGPSDAD